MIDLPSFYKMTKIKDDDQNALKAHGITDMVELRARQPSLYRKEFQDVSTKAQGLLRALLHYLDHNGTDFDKRSFANHMLVHAQDLEQMVKQFGKRVKNDTGTDFGLEEQGFDPSTVDIPDDEGLEEQEDSLMVDEGPDEFFYAGILYKKNHCYSYDSSKHGRVVVAIQCFVVKEGTAPRAVCVRIVPVSRTFLGKAKTDAFTLYGSQYCQLRQKENLIALSRLDDSKPEPRTKPKLCYKPQKEGAKRSFAYFFDETEFTRVGLRGPPKVIELFCGSGGMHLGYKRNGFLTVNAIDKDGMALHTFRHNNPESANVTKCICVNKYLRLYKRTGVVEVLHASSPCQGFSKANRNGGKNDKVNNELALSFTKGLRRTQALVGIFENVSLSMLHRCRAFLFSSCFLSLTRLMGFGAKKGCLTYSECSRSSCR